MSQVQALPLPANKDPPRPQQHTGGGQRTTGGGQHRRQPHKHRPMEEHSEDSPGRCPRGRRLQLPTMRHRTGLDARAQAQQRRGRPHHPARTRRRRQRGQRPHHLPTLQPVTRRQRRTSKAAQAQAHRACHKGQLVTVRPGTPQAPNRAPQPRTQGPPRHAQHRPQGPPGAPQAHSLPPGIQISP